MPVKYTIKPLIVGMNQTDQGIMTYMKYYGQKIFLPIYVFALIGGDKKILIDTGLENVMVPEGVEEQYGVKVYEFDEALASIGWKPEDVDIVIHTHLHNDHCENDYRCTNAKVYVQKAEFEWLHNPHPLDHRIFDDILDDNEVVQIEGDIENLFDGISVIHTPGHTPGIQSVIVDTEAGKAMIVGFCSNEKNFPKNQPPVTPGVHLDVREAYDSVQKVIDYGADILLPLHSMEVGQKKSIP